MAPLCPIISAPIFLVSKFVRHPNKAGSLVLFAVLSNVFNTENVSGYIYSADY